jgi:hypothetical protein
MKERKVTDISVAPGRRTVKFTPERMEQIRTLVKRGMKREQIAETIGVTVGSLQVTCSNKGISLRQRKVTDMPPVTLNNGQRTRLTLVLHRGGKEKSFELDLPEGVLTRVVLEATFSNLTISQLVAQVITDWSKK